MMGDYDNLYKLKDDYVKDVVIIEPKTLFPLFMRFCESWYICISIPPILGKKKSDIMAILRPDDSLVEFPSIDANFDNFIQWERGQLVSTPFPFHFL
jgi:hypothetical protein